MRDVADEESYLRRIVVDQKLESIAARNALALEFPSAVDQPCMDFAFERLPRAAAPCEEPPVERVPYIVPLAALRAEAKVCDFMNRGLLYLRSPGNFLS